MRVRTLEQKIARAAYMREYYRTNPEARARKNRVGNDYYYAHRETLLVRDKRYREINSDNIKARRKANPSKYREWRRRWTERNLDKKRADQRAWFAANPEKKKAYNRTYYSKNAQKIRDRVKQWQVDSPSRNKESKARYYRDNSEAIKQKVHKYRCSNADAVRDRNRRWAQRNRELVRASGRIRTARRKARRLNAKGSFTAKQWAEKIRYYENRCYYCGVACAPEDLTIDHAIPISRGGTEFIANILPACITCNRKKHAKTVFEYLAKAGRKR